MKWKKEPLSHVHSRGGGGGTTYKGFTLLETLVVLVLVSLISGLLMQSLVFGLSGFESQQATWLVGLVFASALIGWVQTYKINKLKHKRSLSLNLWWLMGMPLLLAATVVLLQHSIGIFSFIACAAAIAHWLMVKAKHRLSSFDKLLPFIGLAAAMCSLVAVCIYLVLNQTLLEQTDAIKHFVVMSGLLLLATLLWLFPQLKKTAPPAPLLLVVAFVSFISSLKLQALSV